MQFLGKKGIALFVGVVLAACGAGFGTGLLVGRQFPSHRFERFGETRYLLDATTGKVCDPFKDPNASTNPFDHLTDQNGPSTAKRPSDSSSDPFAAYGGHVITPPPGLVLGSPASSYPPACGK